MIHRLGRATLAGLAVATGEPEHRVRYTLACLHNVRAIFISGWSEVPGKTRIFWVPVYTAGEGVDVPPPKGAGMQARVPSALDHNPGAALQQVVNLWGRASMENPNAEVI